MSRVTPFDRHALLRHRVAVAHRDRAVLERIDVDGDAPRRADLVLASIQLADRGRVVVDRHRVPLQVVLDAVAQLDDLGPLLEQRQDRDLVRREVGVERQRHACLAADLLLAVGVDEEGERGAIRAGRRLDDPRDDVLVGRLVEVLEGLAGGLAVARQVEVAAVVDALQLLPAEREAVLDVDRLLGVVGQLVRGVLAQPQPLRASRRSARTTPVACGSHSSNAAAASASGRTKYCISICSNSRIRKTKLPGEISLRNDLPIWAMPNGSFLRLDCRTFLKLTYEPWAVSGRR